MAVFECRVVCTSEFLQGAGRRPITQHIRLPREEVEKGNLTQVLKRINTAFFPRDAEGRDTRPSQPLNLYAAADLPLTAENLKASLLGVDGLPPPPTSPEGFVLLSYGPTREVTWNYAREEPLPPDSRMFRSVISPGGGDDVSILYESEDMDNSFESLLQARQRAIDRSMPIPRQEMHTYVMPLRALCRHGATKNYKVHFDTGVGIGSEEGLKRALKYGQPKHEGCIIRVVNHGSPIFFADGTFSRFGLGFKLAAFHRGGVLTVAARSEGAKDPTEIVEGTIDLEQWFKRSAEGVQNDKQFPWRPQTRKINVSAEETARLRGQEWEVTDPELPRIKTKAEENPTFFMATTSELKDIAVRQMMAEGGLKCLTHLRHMYFYLTRLPRFYHTPANDGYQCPEIHLHMATKHGLAHFRIDEAPWEDWPEAPESLSGDLLSREDISSRLLRFVKMHSTLPQPETLPRTQMRVQDGFCFGFTHPSLKAADQAELPICLVVLRYLADAGFGRLKEHLGIPGKKVLDIYYKGRLVPLQHPIEDVYLLTKALAKTLGKAKLAAREKTAVEIIQERYYGQVFMQGAMTPDQVDQTKFRLGFLLPLSKDSFKSHDQDTMQYFAVDFHDNKQGFRLSSDEDIDSDFRHFHVLFEKKFDKKFEVSEPLTFTEGAEKPAWYTRAHLTHSFYKKLTKSSGKENAGEKNDLKIGNSVYEEVPNGPKLHSGRGQQYRAVPAKVVAFKVPKGELESEAATSYTGPNAQMVLQLQPKACFNDLSFREVPITKYSPMSSQRVREMKNRQSELAGAASLKLEVLCMNLETLPSSLPAGSKGMDVVVYVSSKGVHITDWLNPAWDGTGQREQFFSLKVVQKIGDIKVDGRPLDYEDPIEDRTGFKFSISKEEFKACGEVKVDYLLSHTFLKAPPSSHTFNVVAGNISKLRITCNDNHVRLKCPTTLFIEGQDVCNNGARLPTDFKADGFSLVNGQPESLQIKVEVLEVQRLQCSSQAVLNAQFSFASAVQPTIFVDGDSMGDITVKGRLAHSPSNISGQMSFLLVQGFPATLELASEETPATLENGACMTPTDYKIKDACGCYVGLPMGWGTQLTITRSCGSDFLKKGCKVDGCVLQIPEGVLLDAATDLQQPLKLEWRINLMDEAGVLKASSPSRSLSLEPCQGKPRKVQLRYQDSGTLHPMGAQEVSQCLGRVDQGSWSEAELNEASQQGTPFYKLDIPNSSTSSRRKVEGLQLILQDDAGSPCDVQAQCVNVQPKERRAVVCVDSNGCFTCIYANPLQEEEEMEEEEQEPDALYRITYSLQQQGKPDLSFFLVVRAVPPAASAWRWCRSGSTDIIAGSSGEVELAVMQPLDEQLSWAAVDNQGTVRGTAGEPLVSLPVPTNMRGSSCSSNILKEQGIIQLCRLEPDGPKLLGLGPEEWDSQLCLHGRGGAKFVLMLSGSGLEQTNLQGRSLAGAPVSFSVHGLPGLASLPGSEASPTATEACLRHHQNVSGQLCVVLQDAIGNASSAPDSWGNNHISLKVTADSPYNATVFQSSRSSEMLPLEQEAGSNILCVAPSSGSILHLSSTQAYSPPAAPAASLASLEVLADYISANYIGMGKSAGEVLLELRRKGIAASGNSFVMNSQLISAPEIASALRLQACSRVKLTFELIVEGSQGGSTRPSSIFRCSTSAILSVAPSPLLVGRVEQELHESLQSAAVVVAGTPWPECVAHLQLVSEAGTVLDEAATLIALAQSIQATLQCPQNAPCELQCRVLDRLGVPDLVVGPPLSKGNITASGTYRIQTAYTEKRPAEAALVRGSSLEQVEASLHFEVQSGAPAGLRFTYATQLNPPSASNQSSRARAGQACTTTVLNGLDAQLVDSFGNKARLDSQSVHVVLSLSRVELAEHSAGSEGQTTSVGQASLPSLARTTLQTPVCDEDQLEIGPVALVEGSGYGLGTCRLRLHVSVQVSSDVQLESPVLDFTFYDERTTSAERIQAHACKAQLDRAQKVLQDAVSSRESAVREQSKATADVEGVMKAAEDALAEPRAQQELRQMSKHAEAVAALAARDGEALQCVLAAVLQQLDAAAAPPPKSNSDSDLARLCLRDFKGNPKYYQYAADVLGLAQDLLTCEDDTARRLAAWKLGGQVIVVVRRKEALAALHGFLTFDLARVSCNRLPEYGVEILSLDLLNRSRPSNVPLHDRFRSQVGSLQLPAFLATFFRVKAVVPSENDMHHRLLQTIIGNAIVLPDLQTAQTYRQQVLARQYNCPDLLTVDGFRQGSRGGMTVGRDASRNQAPPLGQLSWHFGGPLPADTLELQGRLRQAAAELQNLPSRLAQQQSASTSAAAAQARWEEAKRDAERLEAEFVQHQQSLARHESADRSAGFSAGPSTSAAPQVAQRSSNRGTSRTAAQPSLPMKRGRRK